MRGAVLFLLLCSVALAGASAAGEGDVGWPSYGNDPGGTRYSPLSDITPANVAELELAWETHTGDFCGPDRACGSTSAFELTPLVVDGWLYACTPFNNVLALDPGTGEVRWRFEAELDLSGRYANQLVCRGLAHWADAAAAPDTTCARRLFTGTNDGRLIALDARTGKPCAGFGAGGTVDLLADVGAQQWKGEYQVTSPPAIAGDVVIVGSAVGDNQRIDAPSGVVRGFDARTGALRWAFDPAPPGVAPGGRSRAGWALSSPNVWAPIAVDEERDLVFLPTGNPTPDYASEWRKGLDTYGSSVIAVRGQTGERVWSFQTVHHDVWDFDLPAQPTLFELERNGRRVPALVQPTKMGMLFTLHRETGEPLFPVEERPVPGTSDPHFPLSPTQPFPTRPPPLVRHTLSPEDAFGIAFFDTRACRRRLEGLRFEGIYTPPTLQGSVMYPGNAGGSNWGGVAIHPERQVVVANVIDAAWMVRLIPREQFEAERAANPGVEISPQKGTHYAMRRQLMLSPMGMPCSPPPWGKLVAIDMRAGEILWERPIGTLRDVLPIPLPIEVGMPNLGGPLVTGSGLIFLGATHDDAFRAFDLGSGEELWHVRLPAGGQATPATYRHQGRQYVVLAAGGHGRVGTTRGDSILAWALPEPD